MSEFILNVIAGLLIGLLIIGFQAIRSSKLIKKDYKIIIGLFMFFIIAPSYYFYEVRKANKQMEIEKIQKQNKFNSTYINCLKKQNKRLIENLSEYNTKNNTQKLEIE